VVGVPNRTILLRHMLPNVLGPLTVVATFGVATAVLLESSLSFLGLGVRPPEASWGNLITEAISPVVLNTMWWQWVPAAVAITLMVLAVNFVGDGLRDAIDPRTTKKS
jgi:peptide/nickel transport system permease protein